MLYHQQCNVLFNSHERSELTPILTSILTSETSVPNIHLRLVGTEKRTLTMEMNDVTVTVAQLLRLKFNYFFRG